MKLVAIAATVALLAVPAALAATPTLVGTVGPGFTITLTKGGKKVTKLKAGTYMFKIADKSSIHNFHLKGPGIDKKTSVGAQGERDLEAEAEAGQVHVRLRPAQVVHEGLVYGLVGPRRPARSRSTSSRDTRQARSSSRARP